MSLIKIKHYTKDTFNNDVNKQLDQFSLESLETYLEQYSHETGRTAHYFTVSNNVGILGFALLSTLNNCATLHSLYIKKEFRRNSLGKKLTLHLLAKASQFDCTKVELDCHENQLDFFKGLGFLMVKEPKQNSDKIQFKLENPCPDYFLSVYKKNQIERQQTRSKATQPLILSHDKTLYNFHDEAQFLALHRNMLSQAKRRIWLMANAINAPLLNDEQFRQSIIKLAKQNSQAEIRILLEDGKAGAGRFNPLVTLAQRLSSFVEIRSLPSTAHKFTEWVTLVDFSAGIYRKSLDSYSGFATYDSRLIAERLATKFEDQWQFAKPSVEFRRLAI